MEILLVVGVIVVIAFLASRKSEDKPAEPYTPTGELIFQENWDESTEVQGTVLVAPLHCNLDKSDTEQPFLQNNITAKWGTLAGLAGETPDLPNVTGKGSTSSWSVKEGKIYLRGEYVRTPRAQTDGIAIVTKETFALDKPLTLEADVCLTAGTPGAFLGITLISGEGDYREIAYRRTKDGDNLNLVAPCYETTFIKRKEAVNKFRLVYHPVDGWSYFVNDELVGTEKNDHLGAKLVADPHIGIYITGAGPDTWAEGWVGSIKLWKEK
jgi:hypothetical protein